ncbi:hypothetical protein [Sporobacter termitidis]|uniref:hypothetical protein n=1 Tax=Sporobacter termitidis TaxID=44749 RepID=UPI000932404F|nr:hypothetical protein [Sporobacter termitidis]
MSEIERAIAHFEEALHANEHAPAEGCIECDRKRLVIAALREKAARENGCEWCKEFAGIPLRGFTTNGTQSITVRFCPNCGKEMRNHDRQS